MRLVVIALVVVVSTGATRADSPRDLPMGAKASLLDHDTIAVTLLDRMDVGADGQHAVFDWGTAFLTMRVIRAPVDCDDRDAVRADAKTREIDVAHAVFKTLGRGRTAVIPRTPRRVNDPDLVLAAYVPASNGACTILAFQIDDGGLADAVAWADVARAIAATATPGRSTPRPAVQPDARWFKSFAFAVPPGYSIHDRGDAHYFVEGAAGTCTIYDEIETTTSSHAPDHADLISDRLLGEQVEWHAWSREHRASAEVFIPIGRLHIQCNAGSHDELETLRTTIRTISRTPPEVAPTRRGRRRRS